VSIDVASAGLGAWALVLRQVVLIIAAALCWRAAGGRLWSSRPKCFSS
jgi:hypothetical protein